MDRLKSLEVFGRVVEAGGFSAAARTLNISTTMVANHVKALERSLGVLLLQRSTRTVSLTEIGRQYYERTSAILSDLAEANDAAGALVATPRGKLRVYTNTSLVSFLTPMMDEFLASHPQLSIEVETGERMIDMIGEGFDVAIRMAVPDVNLIARKLATWTHILVCSPDYAVRFGAPTTPSDLVSHNCLQYTHYAFGDVWRLVGPSGHREDVKINGSVTSNSAEMLRDLAVRGSGVFFAPSPLVSDELNDGRLVRVMEAFQGAEFAVSAVFPSRSHLPTKVRLFIDALVERFSDHQQFAS